MSDIWPHATKNNPCPICGKPDWCTFGDKAVLCMRVDSTHPAANGGFYHFYDTSGGYRPPEITKKAPPKPLAHAEDMMRDWRLRTTTAQFIAHASSLGVAPEALVAVGAAWAPEHRAWAFPMLDGEGNTIGVRLRATNGFKWAVSGSRQGIFVPSDKVKLGKVAFLPEGPTDTMAALTLGFFAIGRPTNLAGNDYVKASLKRLGIFLAVIVGDNDDEDKQTGKRPGHIGAAKLKRELGLSSVIWNPPLPLKDLRAFLRAGGTADMIQTAVDKQVWSRK